MASIYGRGLVKNRVVETGRGGKYTYMVSFPRVMTLVACTVEGVPERAHIPGRLQEHFMCLHWKDQVTICQ